MDITTITSYRIARTRNDLALAPGEVFFAGGTWLMSEPLPDVTGFVDLTGLDWPAIEIDDDGLRIGATCTIAALVAWAEGRSPQGPPPAAWTAAHLAVDGANALLASFKIWNSATVGGNVCRSFAAAGLVSFAVALDATAWIWRADGTDERCPVAALITGNGTNALGRGDVLRGIEIPASALCSRARLRKIALAELGRSGAVVTGRVDTTDAAVFTVTAATLRPHVLRFEALPDPADLASAVAACDDFYTDPLGSADWRLGVSVVLAERIRRELESEAPES